MKFLNRQKGSRAEEIAEEYLKKEGYKIVTKNFSDKWGEIDIIASKNKILSFVEVKSKFDDMHGEPEGMINASKIKKIQNTAQFFLNKHKKIDAEHDAIRIDVIAIVMEGTSVARLNFYENVGAEFA